MVKKRDTATGRGEIGNSSIGKNVRGSPGYKNKGITRWEVGRAGELYGTKAGGPLFGLTGKKKIQRIGR